MNDFRMGCLGLWRGIIAGLLVLTFSAAQAQTGDTRHVHDPVLIEQGEAYYMYSTGNGIDIRRSTDLVEWRRIGRVFDPPPEWTLAAVPGFREHMWAPDISRVNGKYYLYYSVSTFKSPVSAIGLAINETLDPDDPNYAWQDQGMVVSSNETSHFNAIDPNLIRDTRGDYYLSWGSFWSGLKIARIDPETGKPVSDPPEIHDLASRGPANNSVEPLDINAIEAPFIIRHGDYYYCFVSFDLCCRGPRSTYRLAVGRSLDAMGPYIDRNGVEMTLGGGTLLLAGYGPVVHGPGHNAVLQEDGRTWLAHHMYDKTDRYRPHLQIRPLMWDEDGWPAPGGAVTAENVTGGAPDPLALMGAWTVWEDFGSTRTLMLVEDGSGKIGERDCRWTLEGERLNLSGAEDDGEDGGLALFAGVQGDWLSGRKKDGTAVYAERP
jgi:arabinan endo-1,5-alpha-L-arabinosidase